MDRLVLTFIIVYIAGLAIAAAGFFLTGSCSGVFCNPWKLALPTWLIGFPVVAGVSYLVAKQFLVAR